MCWRKPGIPVAEKYSPREEEEGTAETNLSDYLAAGEVNMPNNPSSAV